MSQKIKIERDLLASFVSDSEKVLKAYKLISELHKDVDSEKYVSAIRALSKLKEIKESLGEVETGISPKWKQKKLF